MSAPLNVLGIYREEIYSNRAVAADRAIMDEVLKEFSERYEGKLFISRIRPEDKVLKVLDYEWDLVFSMAQDTQILAHLDLLEERGTVVVNSGKSIRNCYRGNLSRLLSDADFSYPQYISVNVSQKMVDAFYAPHGYWVKRGDFHALVDEDVTHIEGLDELPGVLKEFQGRGVAKVILQENCEGELFKFYGVRDSFFNLRYMGKTTTDRYSFIAGNPNVQFDRARLEKLVHRAANILELDYFGGDCIVTEEGKIHFIDFNDWPSFRTCRKSAAPTMALHALKKLKYEAVNACNFVQRV